MTNETNPLLDPSAYYEGQEWDVMSLAQLKAAGGTITRVRWIGGEYIPGRGKCYDLSYVHGEVGGKPVTLSHLPVAMLVPARERTAALIAWAKEEGVFAKSIGLLDRINWSILSH